MTTLINNASLMGYPISSEMLDHANSLFSMVDSIPDLTTSALDALLPRLLSSVALAPSCSNPLLISANAAVYGTSQRDAYLHVEMLSRDWNLTPVTVDCILPGSDATAGVNKDFIYCLEPKAQKFFKAFFCHVAASLVFNGNNLSIEDSMVPAV